MRSIWKLFGRRRPPAGQAAGRERRPRGRPAVECLEHRLVLSTGYRSFDGTGNNLANPDWGSTNSQLVRLTTIEYEDGVSVPAGGFDGAGRPNPRAISNRVVAQTESILNDRFLTSFIFQWGQFLDHDLDLSENAFPVENFSIPVPAGDPVLDPAVPIPVLRSVFDPATGTGPDNPRQQVNQITSYIDASNVYGSTLARADGLRTFAAGKLRSQDTALGELLPFNTTGLPNAQPPGIDPPFFVAGDIRSNEQPALTAMHTLFLREHNWWAERIATTDFAGQDLTDPAIDEEIFQRARRIVGAEVQAITYTEFLPALFGANGMTSYDGYDATVNAGVANIFSAALYRVGHTMLPDELLMLDDDGNPVGAGGVTLGDSFFDVSLITDNGIEAFLKGLSVQQIQEIDSKVVDGVRNLLLDPPAQFDLTAINMQRGREHGLPDFNQARADFGLDPYESFLALTGDPTVALALADAYDGDINNIDPWMGGVAEAHLPGSSLGELIHTVLRDQFTRSRDGDRFYYENTFTGAELHAIQNTRLADIIRRNTALTSVQDEVFRADSVLVYRAPAGAGAVDVTLRVGPGGVIQVIDNTNPDGPALAEQALAETTAVVLFGADADDRIVVNLSDPRLRVPVEVHGGGGADALVVVGGNRSDFIHVDPFKVGVNGVSVFYGNVETVEVNAGRGSDFAEVRGPVAPTVIINGGRGSDVLSGNGTYSGRGSVAAAPGAIVLGGGAGSDMLIGSDRGDVLLGGSGSDIIFALGGNDLIIAGRGGDLVFGGAGEDIIIGGRTAHDSDVATLLEILDVWNSGADQAERMLDLAPLLNSSTIFNDFRLDLLFSGLGDDWFPVPFSGDLTF